MATNEQELWSAWEYFQAAERREMRAELDITLADEFSFIVTLRGAAPADTNCINRLLAHFDSLADHFDASYTSIYVGDETWMLIAEFQSELAAGQFLKYWHHEGKGL